MDGTAAPPATAAAPAATDAPPPAGVPAWVPETLKADWGTDSYAEKASKAYAEAHAKLSTRTDDLRRQLETERRAGLPATLDGYDFHVADDDPVAKLLHEANVRIVDELPAQHDGPEHLYALSKDGDATGWWREFCHQHGLPVAAYREGIARIIARDVRKAEDGRKIAAERYAAEDRAEIEKLGQNGLLRKETAAKAVDALTERLLGAEKGKAAAEALRSLTWSAAGVEVIEAIIKATSGGLTPGGGGDVRGAGARPADIMFPKLARR